jgi:hypothetical protein
LFTKLDHFISELPANYAKTELHKMANDYITSYIKPGSLVMINDSIASVIALSGEKIADDIIPEDHIAIWNGLNSTEVKTIPVEYCLPIVNYQINH